MAETKQMQTIDDIYVAKVRKRRIITNSILLSLCLLLAIAIIVLAVLRIDLKPRFDATPDYVYIKVDTDSEEKNFAKSDEETYNQFMNVYNNSLSTSVLTSIFTGNVYGYVVQWSDNSFYQTYSNGVGRGMSSSLSTSLGSNYVHFYFTQPQSIYLSNGEILDGRYDGKEITYHDCYFSISSDENLAQVDFYFGVLDYRSSPITVKISVEAQSFELYEFAQDL